MQGIYWLASYPRSGNTWLRLMLNSYDRGGAAVDINDVPLPSLMYSRRFADSILGQAMGDLMPSEVLALRPTVMRAVRDQSKTPVTLKTHDMRFQLPSGEWQLPADVSLGGVYLVRDPRDVVLSLAKFLNFSIDEAICMMAEPNHMLARSQSRQSVQLVNILGSWSANVASWLSPTPFAVHVVKYEDMRRDPVSALAGILPFLGYAVDRGKVHAAVTETSLDILRDQEDAKGFIERSGPNRFFGTGQIAGWRSKLTPAQAARICRDHEPVMRQLGYLD